MNTGTLEFEGVEYPDAHASDPTVLGLMRGAPPPTSKQIRFADDRFLQFPQIRWALSHVRELVPTAAVWRGADAPSELGVATRDSETSIDELIFEDMRGRKYTWPESLAHTYTDGIVAMHRGARVYERYFGALQPQRPHACFSITKSYAATLAATLIHENVLEEGKSVTHYLPEMRGGPYEGATVRQLLDMQVSVAGSELYSDPGAQFWGYMRAGGFRMRPPNYSGPDSYYEYLLALRKESEHGMVFSYKTVNTEVLCWIMRRVTGIALADMLSERIWARIGCEQDGYLAVDSIGVEMGGAGLNASLRDLCRFGEMMRCDGAWRGRQVIPAGVIADITRGSDPAKFAGAGYTLLSGYSYRNMWWVAHDSLGVYEGRGIHGQRLYIAPKAEVVIARFCSHPIAASAANDPVTLPAFRALTALLMSR
jgi:CubicO group peptidase (beta-lactamase class C family)